MAEYNGLTIGFHGCDEEVARKVILNKAELIPSKNTYKTQTFFSYLFQLTSGQLWAYGL